MTFYKFKQMPYQWCTEISSIIINIGHIFKWNIRTWIKGKKLISLFPSRWWIASKSHRLVTISLHSSELSESHILKALEVNSCFLMWLHHTKLKFLCRTLRFPKICYLTSCLSHNSTKLPRKKEIFMLFCQEY